MSKETVLTEIEKLDDSDLKDIVEKSIDKMSVLSLSQLVKSLEEKYGVSAAAVTPAAVVASGPVASAEEPAEPEEQTEFDVILETVGQNKIKVIKVVKDITGLSLKEAKTLVDAAPKAIKEKVSKAQADEISAKLQEAGATVTVK